MPGPLGPCDCPLGGFPVAIDIGDTGDPGLSPVGARSDHEHPFPAPPAGYPEDADAGPESDGVATTAARSDHKHSVPTAVPTAALDIGDLAVEGVATTLARSDHQHAFPAPVVAPPPIAAAGSIGVATTPAHSDHTHEGVHTVNGFVGDVVVSEFPGFGPAPETIDIGDAGSAGLAATASRSDHEHPFPAPPAGYPEDADAGPESDGVATTAARSDHKHSVPTAAPVSVDKSPNAPGVAATLSRSDHKHDVETAVPTAALDIGDLALEGVATTLARSDHQHAFPAPVVAPPPIAAAGSIGVATTPAHSDHTHEGVHKIIAGTGITVAPVAGTGDVTVSTTPGLVFAELVFTPFDMNKKTPVVPNFDSVQYDPNARLYNWVIEPSTDAGAKRVSLYLRAPDNFNPAVSPVINIHFFVRDAGGVDGTLAKFRVRAGYRADGEDVPGSGGPFDETATSADLTITEPTAPALRHRLTTVTLVGAIAAKEWIYLVIDRAAPAGAEYDEDLYLNVVSFKYGVI